MGDAEKPKWTGNTITDCFLTWVEILEQKERNEAFKVKGSNKR